MFLGLNSPSSLLFIRFIIIVHVTGVLDGYLQERSIHTKPLLALSCLVCFEKYVCRSLITLYYVAI